MSTRKFGPNDVYIATERKTQRLAPEAPEAPAGPAVQNICPKCSGDMIYATSRIYPNSYTLSPTANLYVEQLSGGSRSLCIALVCVICGYTEFYATTPKALL